MDYLWAILVFLAGAIATAGVRSLVERWWRRPRPRVRVLGVTLGPKPTTTKISIDYSLIQREQSSPVLPPLESQMSVNELRDFVTKARGDLDAHRSVMAHVNDLLSRSNILDPTLTQSQQRVEILRKWQEFGSTLEKLGIAVMGHFDGELPSKCKDPHPIDWKSAVLHITEVRDYNLSEINIEVETERILAQGEERQSPDALKRHLSAMNSLRRLWIHLEPDSLKWFFGKVLKYAAALDADAESVIQAVKNLVDRAEPAYLRVDVLVTNDGDRALGVWPSAFLSILLPDSPPAVIPTRLEVAVDEARGMEIVPANRGARLVFYSDSPAADGLQIGSSDQDAITGERLRAMYAATALRCRVAVAVEGLSQADWTLVTSDLFKFGDPVERELRSRLAASVRNEGSN